MLNIEAVAKIAHGAGVPLVVDNTVASPYLCRPIEWGADIVIHSLTKFMGGHGTSLGGVVVDSGKFDWNNGKFLDLVEPDPSYHGLSYTETFGAAAYIARLRVATLRDFGPAMSPFNAFLILQGIETLSLRMERHSSNALRVAEFLEGHPAVSWVNYPGCRAIPATISRRNTCPKAAAALWASGSRAAMTPGSSSSTHVKLLSHLANIGDAKSLVIHPASTTHQQLTDGERFAAGVSDDFIRLSIGIEDVQDLIQDIDQALKESQK